MKNLVRKIEILLFNVILYLTVIVIVGSLLYLFGWLILALAVIVLIFIAVAQAVMSLLGMFIKKEEK